MSNSKNTAPKTKSKNNINARNIGIALLFVFMVVVATVSIIGLPNAASKADTPAAEQTHFEEADSFVVTKVDDGNGDRHGYYLTLEGKNVAFMIEVGVEQYIYYNIGDVIPGTLIADGDNAHFELDQFGEAFVVMGYVGLSNAN